MTERLSDDSRLVLAFIRDNPGLAIEEITRHLNMNNIAVAEAIRQLLHHGVVRRVHDDSLKTINRYYPA